MSCQCQLKISLNYGKSGTLVERLDTVDMEYFFLSDSQKNHVTGKCQKPLTDNFMIKKHFHCHIKNE